MKKTLKQLTLFISCLLLVALVLTCVSAPSIDFSGLGEGTDKVPLNNSVLTGTLPNGLRYFILENSLPENRAHLALVVNAGSVLEKEGEQGLAHFVEHVLFLDTARFPNNEIIEYLRSLGMRFGPDVNAFVSYNETVYHFDVPVEIVDGVRRIPDRALAILDDWTHAASFLPEDVDNERRVVLEEIREWAGAMERARDVLFPLIFAGSAFADRRPIGLAEVVENATPQQLRAFYERWYTSDNMALVFIGDFDGKALEADLAAHFNMPAATQPVNRPVHELPPPRNRNFQVEIFTDPELPSSFFEIYFKQRKGSPRGTIANFRESIIDTLIATMLNLRFAEAALDPNAASTGSWGGTWRWSNESWFLQMGTQPKTGNHEQALIELLLEKESMRRFGFTESELERAKINLVSSMERQLSEKDRRESRTFLRGFINHFLFGERMADIEWELNAVNLLLPGIGSNEVNRRARDYFAPNDIVVFLAAPEADAGYLPSKARIRAIFRETRNARLSPRIDKELPGELMAQSPEPGIIVSDVRDAQTGAYTLTLANGATVILQETANRNNEIIFYAMANGGTANTTEETIVSASLLSEMLNVSGLGPFSRTELINILTGKQVAFSFWTSNFNRGFQGSSTTQDINTLFQMIHLFFTNPRLDERAIAAMIDRYRTNLAFQEEDPERAFSNELTRLINNNHPLFMPLQYSDMDRVCVGQALDFLNLCINPGDYTFIFTGNIDPDIMRDFAAKYIASIPNAPSMNSWSNPGLTRPAEGRRTIYMGVDDRSIVYLGWFAEAPDRFNEQTNQTAAVLSEYLRILLNDEIRENLGGVYWISANASASVIPFGEYRINVNFVCDPERAQELISAVKEQISMIAANPINMDIFNMAREALLMEHDRSMQRNLHIAQSYANSSVRFNTPLNRLHLRPDAVRRVTPQDIQNLCRQLLRNGPVELVLFQE